MSRASAEQIPPDAQRLITRLVEKLAQPTFWKEFDRLHRQLYDMDREQDRVRLTQFILSEIVLPERESAS